MIYTRIKDKRLYPNTVVFQTTDGKGVTYYNASVLEQIKAEIENINLNEVATKYEDRFYGFQQEVIKILDKYKAERR